MVTRLNVPLDTPKEDDIQVIATGLAGFASIDIEFCRLGLMSVHDRLRQRSLLARLCSTIAAKRAEYGHGTRTTWHDSGDVETAWLLQETFPAGFGKRGCSQNEVLESEEAWR